MEQMGPPTAQQLSEMMEAAIADGRSVLRPQERAQKPPHAGMAKGLESGGMLPCATSGRN
jgi:hypothetical protein